MKAEVPVRRKSGPKVKATKLIVGYLDGRNSRRRRTIDLPAGAHNITALVAYVLEASVEFDIPVAAVEAGLAEWFQRTEGELAVMLGGKT